MSEKPIDAVAVLVGFLAWCNEAPNQQHPVVENTRRLCDALAQTLREKASLELRVAELEKEKALALPWIEKIYQVAADVCHDHETGVDSELVALTILDWAERASSALRGTPGESLNSGKPYSAEAD